MSSLKKIACETNLAEATVSRILRKKDHCKQETRERVFEVARRLKYRPNMLVRGMQTGRTKTIGVVMAGLLPDEAETLTGIHDELALADYVPVTLLSGGLRNEDEQLRSDERTQLHRLIDRRVDAVIVHPTAFAVYDETLREVWERDIPLVLLMGSLDLPQADFVGVDQRMAGRLAAEHLMSLGHRTIGHIRGPQGVVGYRERAEGFDQAIADADGVTLVATESNESYHGRAEARDLLNSPDRPTAIFADNDPIAGEVYHAAAEFGLRVPEDLAIMGVGAHPLGRRRWPNLSTIAMPHYHVGRRAARVALERFDHRDQPHERREIQLEPEVVVRGSTVVGKDHASSP